MTHAYDIDSEWKHKAHNILLIKETIAQCLTWARRQSYHLDVVEVRGSTHHNEIKPPGHNAKEADFQEKCEKSSQIYWKNVITAVHRAEELLRNTEGSEADSTGL